MKNNNKSSVRLFGSVKVLVFAALLCALSGVMKFLAPTGDTWRISLENFPIIYAGLLMGPWIGATVGVAADLLGCLIRGFAINPFITLASMTVGLCAGLVFRLFPKRNVFFLVLSVFISHIIGNVIIKTFVLSAMYGMPLGVLFAERSVTYLVTGAVESVILVLLYKNKAIKNGLKRVIGNDEL